LKLFCFGLGYSALALARAAMAEGWQVAGTVRTADRKAALMTEGIEAHVFDGTTPMADCGAVFAGTTHLLDSIPPDGEVPAPVLAWHAPDIARLEEVNWVGYLSTTGVYGDRGGGWVDEETPPAPNLERSRRRLEAEQQWLVMAERYALPVHIFRLAGIYGPGRGVLAQIREGRAKRVVKPGQVFSRIHVEDIVQVLSASMAAPFPGRVYNLADDEPDAPDKVVTFACDLLGMPAPPEVPFDEAELSAMARSFYADNKRVRNERIKNELGVALRYPSYRDGLKADLAGEGAPSSSSG
jgi:nucleoside-diphosphate-sugar epimerase